MKILHVIPSVSPLRGGPSQAVLQMVRALRSQGIEAAIATTDDDGDDRLDVPLQTWTDYEQVPVRFFARFSPAIAPVREFTFSQDLTGWFWQHLSDYDLIHVHGIFSYPSTIAMAIARCQGRPYIIRPLGQLCLWSLQQKPRRKQLYLNVIERQNLQASRALHFTSQQEQQEALPLKLRTPGFVLPHGVETLPRLPDAHQQLRQRLNLPQDEPVILFLSRLHPKKGLEALISALEQVRHQRFRLLIAGSGEPAYEAAIARLLAEAGLQDRSRCLGFISGELKNLLLQGSDLFALPSYSENFGLAVLEAMANGLPVLITPGVALAPLVQQACLGWVTAQEPTAIATALQQFFTHWPLARSMGDRARHLIEDRYSWQAIAYQLSQRYQLLLQDQVPTPLALPMSRYCSPSS